eukprot:CAMPEP_0176493968 /NCGR_PEP_ID=MMETSP0200_2-20121128/9833_1 /TAXON_ID=947934 /ORGANISM="Chaetoceros sp., Strain GSL56" /LENGTH=319 /DNA_ID=CAMNT_0017891669 /DNA_START=105 /DNA_END=1061 /DNA_ORIENTATION=+
MLELVVGLFIFYFSTLVSNDTPSRSRSRSHSPILKSTLLGYSNNVPRGVPSLVRSSSCKHRLDTFNAHCGHDTRESQRVGTENEKDAFYIRKAKYMELGQVVEILIDSFYKPSDLVRPYLYLHELSRLQKNFPHDNNVVQSTNSNVQPYHVFYVACSTCTVVGRQEKIVGFVEVDSRPGTKPNDPPRPYLSDLAVHRHYRRNGIAKALIETCEQQVLEGWEQRYLYLRVDRENYAARNMYMKLGYEWIPHEYFGHGRDTTLLLKKEWENVVDDSLQNMNEQHQPQQHGDDTSVDSERGINQDTDKEKSGEESQHEFLVL